MGSDAVESAGSAGNGDITLPSAKARIISIGRCAPVVTGERTPPVVGQDGGGDE